jgi:arylsulfatase
MAERVSDRLLRKAAVNPRAVIGQTIAESRPAFRVTPRPPSGAPNVVLIVLDDTGFAQLGSYGSDIATPNIDRLAADGLRYRRFHVTALCSPTRACLLTARNHHTVGMGFLPDIPVGFPGYDGHVPRTAGALPRVLRDEGYSTFAVGKWHLAPRWELNASGPFERWPLGFGFERYYGFLAGDTNQYAPELVADNGFVDPPRTPAEGYHLTEDLADRAIRFVQDQQQATPDKPFFLYFATGAMHAPHHVAPEWSDRYRGQFDDGWEAFRARAFARQVEMGIVPDGAVCTERPEWVQEWATLGDDERRLYARMMEVFAGFLSHTDAQIGRVLGYLESIGVLDDTLVMLCSDNGTSAEGGPTGSLNEHRFTHDRVDDFADTLSHLDDLGGHRAYNHYAWGWAWAGNTPFRLWKRYTWLGGVRTPLIVHWPRGFSSRGEVRDQFCHAVDVSPTVLDAVGTSFPSELDGVAQLPTEGQSLRATFDDADAPSPRDTQYFEMLGSRAIYRRGWKATTDHIGAQMSVERERIPGSHDFAADTWSLFNIDDDFSEAVDVAAEHPDMLRSMIDTWWSEAGRNGVLPLDDTFIGRAVAMVPPPWGPRPRAVLRPGGGPVAEDTLPPLGGGFRLLAEVEVASDRASGTIAALGDWNNGFACYLLDGLPVVTFNLFGLECRGVASRLITPGKHHIGFEYTRERGGGGPVLLVVDGDVCAEVQLPHDVPFRWQVASAGMLVGRDRGLPVCGDYEPPFPFEGTIERVVIESAALVPRDPQQEVRAAIVHE